MRRHSERAAHHLFDRHQRSYQLVLHIEQHYGVLTPRNTTTNWATPELEGDLNQRSQISPTDCTWHKTPMALEKRVQERDVGKRRPKECFKCGEHGRFAVVCPTKKQRLTLTCKNQLVNVEEKVTSDTNEYIEATSTEEILEGSQLPVCVI